MSEQFQALMAAVRKWGGQLADHREMGWKYKHPDESGDTAAVELSARILEVSAKVKQLEDLDEHREWMGAFARTDGNVMITQEAMGWCEGYDRTLADYRADLDALLKQREEG